MDNGITYQAYSPGDEKGIIELLQMVFPKWKQIKDPLGNWRWKHLEGPKPSDVYVAKLGEKIVGVMHRIVLDIKIGDSILPTHYGDDLAIHPDHRRTGIMVDMKGLVDGKQVENGIKFHYMTTENPIIKENIARIGFNPTKHSFSYYLKIIDQESFLKKRQRDNLTTKVGVSALSGFEEVKRFFSSDLVSIGDFSLVEVPKFDHRIDRFWDNVKNSYGYCIVKNAEYLNWKQKRPTVSNQRLMIALSGGEVIGFSTLSLRKDEDYSEGSISDLLALPDRLDVVDALIGDACEYFDHENVAAIIFQTTKGHPYESIATRNSFIDASSQNKTYYYYRIVNNSIPVNYINNLNPSKIQLNYY